MVVGRHLPHFASTAVGTTRADQLLNHAITRGIADRCIEGCAPFRDCNPKSNPDKMFAKCVCVDDCCCCCFSCPAVRVAIPGIMMSDIQVLYIFVRDRDLKISPAKKVNHPNETNVMMFH